MAFKALDYVISLPAIANSNERHGQQPFCDGDSRNIGFFSDDPVKLQNDVSL